MKVRLTALTLMTLAACAGGGGSERPDVDATDAEAADQQVGSDLAAADGLADAPGSGDAGDGSLGDACLADCPDATAAPDTLDPGDTPDGSGGPDAPDATPTEPCDRLDNDADGLTDTGCGPPVAASTDAWVHDLGLVAVGQGQVSQPRTFTLSADASGFAVVVLDADGSTEQLAVWQLRDPSGALVAAVSEPFGHEARDIPGFATAVVQVPDRGGFVPASGAWTVTLFRNGGPSHVWLRVVESRRAAPAASTLDLNLWFVGLDGGLSAATAPTDPDFQAILTAFRARLGPFHIAIGATEYFDVTGVDAQKYAYLDLATAPLAPGEDTDLVKLASNVPASNRGLDFFFVMGVSVPGVVAKAGAIPGPPLHHGVAGAGVVVSLANYFGGTKAAAIPVVGLTMAHEMGHQLGLYHTSEGSGLAHDPIADTPECTDDSDQNGKVEPWECQALGAENLMFWSASTEGALTPDQLTVIHRNPALYSPLEPR